MKKYFMGLGVFLISLLLISTVTAVPQTHSKPTMNLINTIEDKKNIIDIEPLNDIINNIKSGGIIDLIIQLITLIIQFVTEIISIIQNVISLVNLVQSLIEAFTTLFQLIQDLIEIIKNIFNPSSI